MHQRRDRITYAAELAAEPPVPIARASPTPAPPRNGSLVTTTVVAAAATAAVLIGICPHPATAPVPALAAVTFAIAATVAAMRWVAAGRDRERAGLAAENAELSRALEDAADRAWELR